MTSDGQCVLDLSVGRADLRIVIFEDNQVEKVSHAGQMLVMASEFNNSSFTPDGNIVTKSVPTIPLGEETSLHIPNFRDDQGTCSSKDRRFNLTFSSTSLIRYSPSMPTTGLLEPVTAKAHCFAA